MISYILKWTTRLAHTSSGTCLLFANVEHLPAGALQLQRAAVSVPRSWSSQSVQERIFLFFKLCRTIITAFWFKRKELALALGLTLSFSCLWSVPNFFFIQQFETKFGMQWTLWGGEFLQCFLDPGQPVLSND